MKKIILLSSVLLLLGAGCSTPSPTPPSTPLLVGEGQGEVSPPPTPPVVTPPVPVITEPTSTAAFDTNDHLDDALNDLKAVE